MGHNPGQTNRHTVVFIELFPQSKIYTFSFYKKMEVRSLIHAETRYRIYAEKVQDLGQNKTRLTEINLVFTILIWWIFKETDNK